MFTIEPIDKEEVEKVRDEILDEYIFHERFQGEYDSDQPHIYLDVTFSEDDIRNYSRYELIIEVFFSKGEYETIKLVEVEWDYDIQFSDEELRYIKDTLEDTDIFDFVNLYKLLDE